MGEAVVSQVTQTALLSGPKIPAHFQQAIYPAKQNSTYHSEHIQSFKILKNIHSFVYTIKFES